VLLLNECLLLFVCLFVCLFHYGLSPETFGYILLYHLKFDMNKTENRDVGITYVSYLLLFEKVVFCGRYSE
jgi:hypothetical protein